MEVKCGCGRPSLRVPQAVHRLNTCEQCSRTRTISQYSDCDNDSGSVDRKCRSYRRSSARSRYVNVCAAACLILLAGGLCRSSAAPAPGPMDAKNDPGPENQLWANPCDVTNEINRPKYSLTLPGSLSSVATNILRTMNDTMKDDIAQKLIGAESFESALPEWKGYDWMDKFMKLQPKGFREKALPSKKKLGKGMQPIMEDIDKLLPYMYKAAKMILAGMFKLKDTIPVDNAPLANDKLKENFMKLTVDMRAFNCALYEIVSARHRAVLPLYDNEIPDFSGPEEHGNVFLLFRDTLWYLEYMKQVADEMQTSMFVPRLPEQLELAR